jgi:outer membrane protein assembly factor BamB
MTMKKTPSYSRDVDASALILENKAYIGLENGIFTVFDPDPGKTEVRIGVKQPKIYDEETIYAKSDIKMHGGNLVTEASPARLGDRVYVASGAGHVYGYNLKTQTIDWDFYIGSDMDGSPVVTYDDKLLIAVEKQYISGQGGIFKLDPSKDPENAVVWYFPTPAKGFHTWQGGVIGSATMNDSYVDKDDTHIAVFQSVDGNLFGVEHDQLADGELVWGPNRKKQYPTPKLLFQEKVGESISTALIINDRVISATYKGIRLYQIEADFELTLLDEKDGVFESTPFIWDERIYVASKNGYLYCFGEGESLYMDTD